MWSQVNKAYTAAEEGDGDDPDMVRGLSGTLE
jgi:hypothetical protein